MSEEAIDPIYKKGFEHGYWLKRGESPELRDLIIRLSKSDDKSEGASNYYKGIVAGEAEAKKELLKAKIDRMFDKGKEKGGNELER
jgi:hypothetical protein